MKAPRHSIDGSIRSRLSRGWFWCSLVLLIALLVYWPIAAHVAGDFRDFGADDSFPAIGAGLGHQELAWIVEAHAIFIWHAADPAGGTLPLINRYGFQQSFFQKVAFDFAKDESKHYLLGNYFITYRATTASTGSPVTIHLLYIPMIYAAVALFIGPGWVAISRSRQAVAAHRVFRRRRIRNAMGHCVCGYDLRQSNSRCPECGRAFRRVPVSVV